MCAPKNELIVTNKLTVQLLEMRYKTHVDIIDYWQQITNIICTVVRANDKMRMNQCSVPER